MMKKRYRYYIAPDNVYDFESDGDQAAVEKVREKTGNWGAPDVIMKNLKVFENGTWVWVL